MTEFSDINSDGIGYLLKEYSLFNKIMFDCINLRENNLSKSKLYILLSLLYNNDITIGNIAKLTSTSKEQTSRAVSALEKNGFVKRKYDETNKRIVIVHLTKEGNEFIVKGHQSLHKKLGEKFSVLTDEEKQDFFAASRKLFFYMKKIITQQQ